MLFTTIAAAQEQISIGIYQDAKLTFYRDNHGNEPFTADIIITANLEGKQFKHYYFSLQPFYEYADLYGDKYHRYGFNLNWNLNNLIIENTTITIGGGIGMIHRPYGSGSYQLNLEVRHAICNWLDISLRNEFVKRTDLPNKKLGYNLHYGLIFKIN